MTVVARTEKEQCTAFGNKRRCRLVKRPGFTTCHIHRNYYKDWIDRNPPPDHWTKRQRAEYIFQISRGLVEIPERQVVGLRLTQVHYFEILMRYTHHSPMLNIHCFTEYIFLRLGNVEEHILKDVDSCYIVFKSIVLRTIILREVATPEDVLARAVAFLSRPSCRQILYSAKLAKLFELFRQIIRIYAEGWEELYDLGEIYRADGLIQTMMRQAFSVNAFTVRARCAIYKEELMKVAWSPSRIEKWLESGYDVFTDV
jgi:hypothetical protein